MYLAVTEAVVSFVLCSFRNEKMMYVYYVSHVLAGAEMQYSPLDKNIFTLTVRARKLKSYFQAHLITMFTTVPLWHIMHKPDLIGRMTEWVLELSEYEIYFKPRRIVQAHELADFVVENTLLTAIEPAHLFKPQT